MNKFVLGLYINTNFMDVFILRHNFKNKNVVNL